MSGEDRGGHPRRQVGRSFQPSRGYDGGSATRHVYEDAVNLNGTRPIGVAPMVHAKHLSEGAHGPMVTRYQRPANQGPTIAGGPLETADYISDPNYRGRKMSQPNPGHYTQDEISNMLEGSGP